MGNETVSNREVSTKCLTTEGGKTLIKYGIPKEDLELIKLAHSNKVFEKDAELDEELKRRKRNPNKEEESQNEGTIKSAKKS